MSVLQISVYLENVKGTLCKVTSLLAEQKIDILALTIADTAGFGLVRLIVREKDLAPALTQLQESGYSARINPVLCLKVPNEPGGLNKVLQLLEAANVGIEYMYSFNYSKDGQALLIFRLTDVEAGTKAIADGGIELVYQNDINLL